MKAVAILDTLTGRIRRLQLKAESFEEERILGMLMDGVVHDGTLFELTRDGRPQGSFVFNQGREEQTP